MASPVATVWSQLRLDISDFASKLNTASASLRRFANTQQKSLKEQNQGYASASSMIKSFNRSLSDTINITRGIVISQAFYAAVGAIQDATNALWTFNKELDYAHVTYSALFGDATLANDFMSVLQEHAIETIFNYQDLAGISKKLLAYGIDYKNLMFIMEGLTNLGTMSGDSAALDRIALALGQIYTKGKLSAEEMRQLANAYVPITDIIKEKFNLSEDDLSRVGDLNLPAEEVINAIVDYANERFGSVGDAAMFTITGLEAKIVDTLKVVGSEMIKPLTNAYKSFLMFISNGLENIRAAFNQGGLGGVFEYLVPDEATQKAVRMFLANIRNLFMSVASLGKALGRVFGHFAQAFVAVFNAVIPAVTALINTLAIMIEQFASTSEGAAKLRRALVIAAGAFLLMKVQAMGALVVTVVTKAVTALSKALSVLATVITKHPILSMLAILGMALVGVSVSSESANNSLSGLFDTLTGAGGASSGDILQKTEQDIKDAEGAIDNFNDRLGEGADGAEDLENGLNNVGKAAKKNKSLLSFDEVFKLNDTDAAGSSAASGALDGIGDIIDGLGTLGDALIPEIPDFSEYISDFGDSLFGGLSEGLMDKISAGGWGAAIGGILGALIGLAFGNPVLGAKIGMAAGAVVGVIFDELEYAISNVGTGVLAGIGTAISKAFGGSVFSVIKEAFTNPGSIKGLFKNIAAVFTGTGMKAIAKNGIIGLGVGLIVDGLAHLLWSWLDEEIASANADTAKIGQTIGGILGSVIGGIIGGPAGMMIGSAIGTFVGGFIGLFWEPIKQFFVDLGMSIAKWMAGIVSDINNWLDKTGISKWASDTWTAFSGWFSRTATGFGTWSKNTLSAIGDWVSNTYTSFNNWRNKTSSSISSWWSDTKKGFSTWWNDTVAIFSDWDSITSTTLRDWVRSSASSLSDWFNDTTGGLSTWITEYISGISNWASNTKSGIAKWCSDSFKDLSGWFADTRNGFDNWQIETRRLVHGWVSNIGEAIATWARNTWNDISSWATDTWNSFIEWSSKVTRVVGGFCLAAQLEITTWVTNTANSVRNWSIDVGNKFSTFFNDAITKLNTWLSNMRNSMSTWFSNIGISIKTWWNNAFDPTRWQTGWSRVQSWFTGVKGSIQGWFLNLNTSIRGWWSNLFNVSTWRSGWEHVRQWFSKLLTDIGNWFTQIGNQISTWWNNLWTGKSATFNGSSGNANFSLGGHATGGIFDREHIARFAEGNKAEAVIPLENARAMQPFVDAISNGIVSSLAPITAMASGGNGGNNLPPLYVGTLVADERGLRELYKKFEIIQVQENARRGVVREVF